ncbi:DoxX family protein [Streptantibioticus parmotrematis]|uniref:DoxX family protein n=1 Tax=Streptantibioticus parmotrematis TaxID=2873249 RepID=UPI0033C5AB4A
MSHRKDLGLLALRLAVGGVLFAHGTQKLFGWFGGPGIEGTAQGMEQMGFRPGRPSALAAGLGETGGGTLLALGLATPAAGAAAAGTMASAVSFHLPNGFFAANGGFESAGLVGAVAAGLGIAGPGRYSLDHATCHVLDRPWVAAAAFAASAAAASVVIGRRQAALAAGDDARDGGSGGSGDDTAES